MSSIACGCVKNQKIVVAFDVPMEILEALAAERGFVELQALDHGAHGAVEHEDALACEIAELVGDGMISVRTRGHQHYSRVPPLPAGERVGVRGTGED